MRRWGGAPLLIICALLARGAFAQDYPTGPVKLVVPFTAGSVQDLRARHIASLLSPRLGKAVVVENKAGANGVIGADFVAKSRPDGYTLLLCTGSTHSGNAALIPNLPYNPEREFVPIVRLITTSGVVAVSAASSVRSLAQLISVSRAAPESLRYGAGSSYGHLLGELVSRRAGIKMLRVPYKGDSQVINDVLGGHIDVVFTTPLSLLAHIRSGRIRPLAIAGSQRLSALPDVPTLHELGVRNAELPAWAGICAPLGTPQRVIARLNREVVQIAKTPEMAREIERQGYEVAVGSAGEFRLFIGEDVKRTKALVSELNIPLEQ